MNDYVLESHSSEITIKSFQFTWQIENYSSHAQNCAPETPITSPPFVFYDKESWMQIFFYPKGDGRVEDQTDEDEKWSAINVMIGSEIQFHGIYHIELAILDVVGQKFRFGVFHKEIPLPTEWGFKEFIFQSELENPSNNLLPDDKLTILCRIERTDSEDNECDCPDEDVQTPFLRRRLVQDYATQYELG